MDVDTFKLRLTTLPSLTRTDRASYQQRSEHKGANLSSLFREAQRINRQRKDELIREKKRNFERLVEGLSLSYDGYNSLMSSITEDTDIYKLKQRAENAIERRNKVEMGELQDDFYKTIKNLNIDQSDIADLIQRFNEGEDVGVLTQKAYDLERKKKVENISSERQLLKNALTRLELTQLDKDRIMNKFQPGEKAVTSLIREAERIKSERNQKNITSEKRELVKLAKKLELGGTFSNQINRVKTQGNVKALTKIIENAGKNKKSSNIALRKLELDTFARKFRVFSQFAGEIASVKTLKDANVTQINIREAIKKKLLEEASNVGDYTSQITSIKNIRQLEAIKKRIEQDKLVKKLANQKSKTEKLEKSKKGFALEVQIANIPQNKKQQFINRLKLKNVDIPKLEKNLNNVIKTEKNKKKQNELNELKKYTKRFDINATPFIQDFQTSNISLNAIKKNVDNAVMKKKTLKQMKEFLNQRIKKASLNQTFVQKLINVKTKNNALSLNAEIDQAYKTKIKSNKKTLSNMAIESGLNLMTNIAAIEDMNTLKKADAHIKFQSKQRLQQMAQRLGVNVPIENVQTNKNVKNVKNSIETAYTTKQKERKAEFDRIRKLGRANLEVFLNKYSKILKPGERSSFLKFYDKGANLKVLKMNIHRYATQKKKALNNHKVYAMQVFLNDLGMVPEDRVRFVNRVIAGENMNVVKKDSKLFMTQVLDNLRRRNADKMFTFLQNLKIKPQNINRIMKKFETTYVNLDWLKKQSKKIENMRNHGNWVESNDEFLNFVDELPIEPGDKVKIKSNFDSDLVNFNTIVNTTIKTTLDTKDAKQNALRRELMTYINKHKLNTFNKRMLLKKLNTGKKNIYSLKKEANMIKSSLLNQEQMKKNKEKMNYLNTFKILTNREKMYLLPKNKSEVEKYHNRRKRELRFKLRRYIVDNLGLTMDDPKIMKIFEKFDTAPENYNEYARRAAEIKKLRNEKNRLKSKTRNTKILEDIDEIKNLVDVAKINSKINKEFMTKMKKKLSDLILNSGMKIKLNLSRVNTPQQINAVMMNIKKAYQTKRFQELQQLRKSVTSLTPQDQNEILQEFMTTDVPIKTSMKKIMKLQVKMTEEKHKVNRNLLQSFYKNELKLNSKDISNLLSEFDTSKNTQKMKTKGTQLKKLRTTEKISGNRLKLEKIIDSMNLSNTDKKTILTMYDKKPNNVMLYETTAKQINAARKKELKNKDTANLSALLKSLKLSETNTKKIVNSFTTVPNTKLSKIKSEAIRLRKRRDREKLTNALRPLSLSENNRKVLLADTDNVNAVIKKAKNLSAQKKTKNTTQNQLRQYIGSKNLGNKGKNLLNKINDTLTNEDVESIRAKANRLKNEMNATKISKMREEIDQYINKKPLSVTEKRRILQSVNSNTNVNAVKRNIQNTLNNKSNKENAYVKNRTELQVYINTLNLPNTEKQRLISSNNSVSSLKSEAYRLSEYLRKLNLNRKMNAFKREKTLKRYKAANNRRIIQGVQQSKALAIRTEAEEYLKSLKRPMNNKNKQLLKNLSSKKITLAQFKKQVS
jgi:hypothetical protein